MSKITSHTGLTGGHHSIPAGKRQELTQHHRKAPGAALRKPRPELTHHEDHDGNITIDFTDEIKAHQARENDIIDRLAEIHDLACRRTLTLEERVERLELACEIPLDL